MDRYNLGFPKQDTNNPNEYAFVFCCFFFFFFCPVSRFYFSSNPYAPLEIEIHNVEVLICITLWAYSADDNLAILVFSYFFQINIFLAFHANCLHWRQLALNVKPDLCVKKNLLKFTQRKELNLP